MLMPVPDIGFPLQGGGAPFDRVIEQLTASVAAADVSAVVSAPTIVATITPPSIIAGG